MPEQIRRNQPAKNKITPAATMAPGSVIRMKQPAPNQLPQQKVIDDDAVVPVKAPWWKKPLKRVLIILLTVLVLVFAYVFLLMGEPEEDMQATEIPPVQPITMPMNALEAPGEANVPALAEAFGEPVLALFGNVLPMQRARVFDTAFNGEYARRVTLTYSLEDGSVLLVDSIRPVEAIALLSGDYLLKADRLYAMAGMDAARMQNDHTIILFGQSQTAVYAITLPRAHEGQLETLLKQTLLVTAPEAQ